MPVDHWMVFGTFAEQDYFEYPEIGTYQGVLINANMAAHAPAGLAAFLLEKTAVDTKYLIDPLTHAFQHDPGVVANQSGKPKSSIKRLAEAYGSPIVDCVGNRPMLPEDFDDDGVLEGFVGRCLEYQRTQLAGAMQESEAAKYLDDPEEEVKPHALIAPYFYVTESSLSDWLPINRRAIEFAKKLADGEKLFASVVISRGILVSEECRDSIVETVENLDLDGVLLWVDELDEQQAGRTELEGLLHLARGLRQGGRDVINTHGGYFSVLAAGRLGEYALTGVAHGPEFGEYRPVIPVGGGIPIARYYVPMLHARVRYQDALSIFRTKGWLDSSQSFHENVCDCDECVETLAGDPAKFTLFGEGVSKTVKRKHGLVRIEFPTSETKSHCLKHYLQRKRREYIASSNAPTEALLNDLEQNADKLRDVMGLDGVSHLRLWKSVFGGN